MHDELALSLRLPAHPVAVGIARGVVRSLRPVIGEDEHERAELAMSEIVTNAIRHGSTTTDDVVEIDIVAAARRVTAVVRDHGPRFEPPEGPAGTGQVGGFGLHIVRALGQLQVRREDGRNAVTFTVANPAPD